MEKILNYLDGKKTYISAFIIFCAGGALALGWISQEAFEKVSAFAGSLAIVSLRVAMKKLE